MCWRASTRSVLRRAPPCHAPDCSLQHDLLTWCPARRSRGSRPGLYRRGAMGAWPSLLLIWRGGTRDGVVRRRAVPAILSRGRRSAGVVLRRTRHGGRTRSAFGAGGRRHVPGGSIGRLIVRRGVLYAPIV